ncbi:helix-turn-helix transcriptional regulator [Actinomadura sp. DC4]|uniref:helix-turn-helix domain-containing protein n=1 Tax=Actinomadura sp. DC4 TaxID=3055069 RepID=UPI0025B1815F|nr:helix-turn-helix transcriptional regulator [Actinomadura sp. DC4]MDN3356028.1 helix-turn-helix transcriptional regulator [Actinomadura sp. DC4]
MTQNDAEERSPMQGRRINLGLSLRALSVACSQAGGPISDSQLSKIERGVCVPRPSARRAITQVLGLDPVTGDEPARIGGKS